MERGILQSYLTDVETGSRLGLGSNGSARAQRYDDPPIVRMSNTFFEPGDYTFDELLDGFSGIYFVGWQYGYTTPTTGMLTFKSREAYVVEHGELRDHLRDAALSAMTLEVLHNISAGASVGLWSEAIANTRGVEGTDSGTQASIDVDVVAHERNASGNGFEYAASRRFDLDVELVGRTAGAVSLSSMNPRPIQSGKMAVVFDPLAVGPVIAAATAVSADDVQRDRSFLTGKIGEQIAVTGFTLVDDGLLRGGLETRPFDAEGVPSQRTLLIENGVLRSFLFDSYAANKEGIMSTGNASRGDYRQPPSISPTNLIIGQGGEADIMKDVRHGIYVRATGDHPNMSTGEFSGMVYAGYAIEDGECKHALKQTNIGINVLDLLKQIDGLSRDVTTYFGLTTPKIRVTDVSVASSG